MADIQDQGKDPHIVVDLKLKFLRISLFREMGRYQYILGRKSMADSH